MLESHYTNPFDNNEVTKLLEVGNRYFPDLFTSTRHLSDNKTKPLQLFDMIKNFSLKESNVETITKAILKLSMYRSDWFELSSFMLKLLLILKNKKILVPYAGLGYCFDIIQDLEKKFKLTKQSLSRYVKDYFAITEGNLLRSEAL